MSNAMERINHHSHVTERLMFLPTGEVFKDERNSSYYHSDFLFSGKEVDEETGLSYFGARYLDSHKNIWLSPDPMQLKYPHVSSYAYCAGNPLTFIDLWGKEKLNAFNLKGESENLVQNFTLPLYLTIQIQLFFLLMEA